MILLTLQCAVCSKPMGDLLDNMFIHSGKVNCETCYSRAFDWSLKFFQNLTPSTSLHVRTRTGRRLEQAAFDDQRGISQCNITITFFVHVCEILLLFWPLTQICAFALPVVGAVYASVKDLFCKKQTWALGTQENDFITKWFILLFWIQKCSCVPC